MRRRRGSCGTREHGAVLVEAAIATPVIVAAVAGLVLTSVLWRDQLAVSEAAAVGARTAGLHPAPLSPAAGSLEAAVAAGTPRVAAAVLGALSGVPLEAVERLVIFGAPLGDEGIDAVPPGCRFAGAPAPGEPCVVLGPGALADPTSLAPCGPGSCDWRDAPGVAAVGVLVRVRQVGLLGGLVAPPVIEGVAVTALEGGARA